MLAYNPIYGAYTGLFAGLSPKITMTQNGCYIAPWGRVAEVRADIVPELRDKNDGTAGKAERFWDYCEAETRKYLCDNC
jgi:retinol dehydrogenase-12